MPCPTVLLRLSLEYHPTSADAGHATVPTWRRSSLFEAHCQSTFGQALGCTSAQGFRPPPVQPMTVVHVSSVPASTGHVGTRRDSEWDTTLSWMGHHFGSMGHQMGHYLAPMGHHFVPIGHKKGHHSAPMGHYFAVMGHQMGHQSAKMGHEGTPTDTKMMSVGVMVKQRPEEGSLDDF